MIENSKFCVKNTDAGMACFKDGPVLYKFQGWLSQLLSKHCVKNFISMETSGSLLFLTAGNLVNQTKFGWALWSFQTTCSAPNYSIKNSVTTKVGGWKKSSQCILKNILFATLCMYEREKSPRITLLWNLNAEYPNNSEKLLESHMEEINLWSHDSGISVFDSKFWIINHFKIT